MKLTKDLSKLTTISEKRFNFLINKCALIIANAVYETKLLNEELTEIDLGIGVLYIKNTANELKYKFVPSNELADAICLAMNGKSMLEEKIDEKISEHLLDSYKDMF